MRRSPRNVRIAFNHAGLTHYGGAFFLHEFLRVLQLRNFLARRLRWDRRNRRYSISQMILALVWPIILGLDRIEAASLLRSNGTFQFLTGLPSFPDPQTLRRFMLGASDDFYHQMVRLNDQLLQLLIHEPSARSRLIFDFDSTVLTTFGKQEGAERGYNPTHRGKRSYQPLLGVEAGSAHLWSTLLRAGNTDPHSGTAEMLRATALNLPVGIREFRVRADAGFYNDGFLTALEDNQAEYAVVAKVSSPMKRLLPGLRYQFVNRHWEMADFSYGALTWSEPRKHVVARRLIQDTGSEPTLFTLGRYQYRCWATNLALIPRAIWHFYDGRAAIEARIKELRRDFALGNIPTRDFSANAFYLEVIRLAYNLVTAFQRICLPDDWQGYTLSSLQHHLLLLPGELTRPRNRPVLRLPKTGSIEELASSLLAKLRRLRPLE